VPGRGGGDLPVPDHHVGVVIGPEGERTHERPLQRPAAHAGGAHVDLGAGVVVVARGAVGLAREAARSVAVAGARLLALRGRGAGVRRAAAHAGRAHIGLRTGHSVITHGAVRLVDVAARPVAEAGAARVALIGRGAGIRGAAAHAAGAHIG